MTADEHVANVSQKGADLAAALTAATEAGVSPVLLMPALVTVFKEAGLMPAGMALPGFGG